MAKWILTIGLTLSTGFFLFGISLVILVGLFRLITGLKLKEGEYKMTDIETLK